MVLARSVELSLNTVLTAMSQAGCGEPHQIFAGGLRYIPPSAANGINREALGELGEAGLAQGNRLTDDFEDTLYTLGRPHTEYYAHVRTGDEQYGVLVAVRGREAVTALCQNGDVWLKPAPREDRPGALIANLPDFAPASFAPFSLPQRDFPPAGDNDDLYDTAPPRTREARRLDEIFAQPYYGIGHIYTARHPNDGRRAQATDTLTYLDIDAGRVGIELTGAKGNQYINVIPGERPLLARKLTHLRASLDD